MLFRTIDQVWRFFKILAAFTFLVAGFVLFFTPVPGLPVIFLGLTLLAAEFVWAKRLMHHMKSQGSRLKETVWRFGKPGSV